MKNLWPVYGIQSFQGARTGTSRLLRLKNSRKLRHTLLILALPPRSEVGLHLEFTGCGGAYRSYRSTAPRHRCTRTLDLRVGALLAKGLPQLSWVRG